MRTQNFRLRHGYSGTPTYNVWCNMVARCTRPQDSSWKWYGARGIDVCDRWREDFVNFLADMGEKPDGMTLDRWPDNDGDYEPDNCRLATPLMQARHTRSYRLTDAMILEIKRLHDEGLDVRAIVTTLDVSRTLVSTIVRAIEALRA
jgi:hypothetical protein